jgi:cytochrome c-type biogenesis protein CcmE
MSLRAKIALTIAIIAGGVGYMIYTTISSGTALEYFKHVDEVMAQPAAWQGQHLQIHGNIVAGTILKRAGSLDYKFALHRGGKWLDVTYTGLVPDNFKDCGELVVKGRLLDDLTLAAEELSAKCPSKYDGKRQMPCGNELQPQVLSRRK